MTGMTIISDLRRAFEERWRGPSANDIAIYFAEGRRSEWRRFRHDGRYATASPFNGLAVQPLPPMDHRTGGLSLEPGGVRVLRLPPWTHHTTASTADGTN
jgi:hypothetical protein